MKFARPASPKNLLHAYHRYGPIPRMCFGLAGDERRMDGYDREIEKQLRMFPSYVEQVRSNGFTENFASSCSLALMIIPNESRLPHVTFASRHIVQVASAVQGIGMAAAFQLMQSDVVTRKWAQDTYKDIIIDRISSGSFNYSLYWTPLLQLSNMQQDVSLDRVSPPHRHVSLTKLPTLRSQTAYVFEHQGIRTYSALLMTQRMIGRGSKAQSVHLFQVASDFNSPILVNELDELADMLPQELQPSSGTRGGVSWYINFIVQPIMKIDFTAQPFHGVGKRKWAEGLITQYVAGVEM